MCVICSDWIKGSITRKEAWRNLNEIQWAGLDNLSREEVDHFYEVAEMLAKDQNETNEL